MPKPYRPLSSLLLLIPSLAFASPLTPRTLSSEIESLLQHNMPRAEIGIAVADATTGKMIYERLGHQAFTPASNTKVLTAAASLFELGPDYVYHTQFMAKPNSIHNKVLRGDLTLQFEGDPSLRIKHLRALVQDLKSKVNTIKGDLIIDNTHFSGTPYAPGWSQEDLNWYYNAPVSTVILGQNTVDVNMIPGSRLGNSAKLKVVSKTLAPYFSISDTITTVTFPQSMKHCSLYPHMDQNNHLTISGCWPISNKARTLHFAIRNPDQLMSQMLPTLLKEEGIKLAGKVKIGTTPKAATAINTHASPPLKSMLRVMLKDSNNIYAESFTKALGAKVYGQGTFQEGLNVVRKVLYDHANIDQNNMTLSDGSGASRYNLVTPRQLVRVLFVMAHTPELYTIFRNALPESGRDGTLKRRMKSFDLKNKLYAKTGSMGGVSTLSGYITTRDNHHLIFAIMMNHLLDDLDNARNVQAKIATLLYAGEPWDNEKR